MTDRPHYLRIDFDLYSPYEEISIPMKTQTAETERAVLSLSCDNFRAKLEACLPEHIEERDRVLGELDVLLDSVLALPLKHEEPNLKEESFAHAPTRRER